MKVKITVGICVKNCEATIKEAIDSVLNQDFPHKLMEIIVVDGDSKDRTLSIVNHRVLKTDIPVKIYNDEGKGLGVARQIVVDNSGGEYIAWVDGDVILSKDYLQKQVEFMDQNPQIGAAQGKWEMPKKRTLVAALEYLSAFRSTIYETKDIPLGSLGTVGGIYRAKALRCVGGFDNRIKGAAEDRDLTFRIRAAGWLLSLSPAKLCHRYNETWKGLWDKYSWWGYGAHFLNHKHKGLVILWHRVPIIGFAAGLRRSVSAYKKTNQKISFLLPFHNFFKLVAWCSGFLKSHIKGYGHELK